INEFGQQEGMRVHAETDSEVQKALELMPQAKQLAENARKTIAQHNAARLTAQQSESANSSR
ncbi:MAG: S41 family peptidase, partial [Candidatus Korobacteraceae bacterium]